MKVKKSSTEQTLPKVQASKTAEFAERPSKRLINTKFAAATDQKNTTFQQFYSKGKLPCKINHGSINNKLVWDQSVNLETISFDPLLLHFFDGLKEQSYPYNFIAREAVRDLLSSARARERVFPILPQIVEKMRLTLSQTNVSVFQNALVALTSLSECLGEELNPSLKFLLSPIGKCLSKKELRFDILNSLATLEKNGGAACSAQIKIKIPTYTPNA